MKVLTLWQPWATLVAIGAKRIETRSWRTNHRGPLAIHAAASTKGLQACYREPFRSTLEAYGYQADATLPHMRIIAICNLADILPTQDVRSIVERRELAFGDYANGRHAWLLGDVMRLGYAIPVSGRQGLWTYDYSGETTLIRDLIGAALERIHHD